MISKKRGKPSNRRISSKTINRAKKLIVNNYQDFGPTLAKEKLEEVHEIKLSRKTIRKQMVAWGLWEPAKKITDASTNEAPAGPARES